MEPSPTLNPSSIINLNLSSKNLASIEEIKQYKNLIELDISNNNFKDPDTALKSLGSFIYLRKINLSYNKLHVIPTLPKSVEILILNNNLIISLQEKILQTPRLTTIDLSNNFIADISILQKMQSLKYIFLKNNKIKSFGCLSNLPKLQELDLEGNDISNPEDLNLFANHQTIKIIFIRNTPLSNLLSSEQSIKCNPQTLFVSLPVYKEGAFCRSERAFKGSFTYTNMLESSNPNRSVLINRSLITSKKHISEEDLSDEFSFDQIPHDVMNGSLLGSIRSNILENADPGIYDSSRIRDRSNNISLDLMNRGILNTGSRVPTIEREITKGGSSRNHESQPNNNGTGKKIHSPFMKRNNKFDMRLDLSTILKAGSFDKVSLGFQGLSYANFRKNDTKKQEHSHHIKMEFPAPQFGSTNRSQALENKSSIPLQTENDRFHTESIENQTLNSFVNHLESGRPISSYRITFQNESISLNEVYEGLKKENQDLRNTKEELTQKLVSIEKENINLNERVLSAQDEIKNIKVKVDELEDENKQLKLKSKEIENEMQTRSLKLQFVLEKFIEKENEEGAPQQQVEVLEYDGMIKLVQEKLKELEDLMHVDMNARIIEKFDQLRNYYKNKMEKLIMNINDLESKISFQLNEKILYLERNHSILQTNYNDLIKNYNKLKHDGTENKKQNVISHSNNSIATNSRQPLSALNLSVGEASPVAQEGSRIGKTETSLGPKIHVRKEGKTEENTSKLKIDNFKLKMSLESFTKKIDILMRENEELKTAGNGNTNLLKTRVKELERENSKLLAMTNQKKFILTTSNNCISIEKNETSTKTQNVSGENESSCPKQEVFKYPTGKKEPHGLAIGDLKLKNHLLQLKKKYESIDKEQKNAKERKTSHVKKISSFVDYGNKSNDLLNDYTQLRNLCFQFQDTVQNT